MEDKLYLANKYSAYEVVMIVHELHQRGYEQLRILCGMGAHGFFRGTPSDRLCHTCQRNASLNG